MYCPFLLYSNDPPACEVLGDATRGVSPILFPMICTGGWERLCPYWRYALKGWPDLARPVDWTLPPDSPILHIGHVNRRGGYRLFLRELT